MTDHHAQALGEADAELATLSRYALVNAVVTDDPDVLLFGAKNIVRL